MRVRSKASSRFPVSAQRACQGALEHRCNGDDVDGRPSSGIAAQLHATGGRSWAVWSRRLGRERGSTEGVFRSRSFKIRLVVEARPDLRPLTEFIEPSHTGGPHPTCAAGKPAKASRGRLSGSSNARSSKNCRLQSGCRSAPFSLGLMYLASRRVRPPQALISRFSRGRRLKRRSPGSLVQTKALRGQSVSEVIVDLATGLPDRTRRQGEHVFDRHHLLA